MSKKFLCQVRVLMVIPINLPIAGRRKRKKREKTASSGQPTKFRAPPDEVRRGRYRLCSRLEIYEI